MQDRAFARPGRFFRGNLHTHSSVSDGALPPGEVCRRYAAHGYDFIALTDHFLGCFGYPVTDTTRFRTARFTTLPGAELHAGAMENGEIWHILAVGLPADFPPPDAPGFAAVPGQESGPALAARARAAGAFVAIAHPEWSGLTTADARSLAEAAHAVEVYNHGCAVDCDRGHGHHTLDQLLSEGRRLTLCATDDAHFRSDDQFGGWVMVKAGANAPDALLAALREGAFYASTGPELHDLHWEDGHVHVACSAAARVIVQGRGTATDVVHGPALTRVSVPLARVAGSPWARVTVVDAAGGRAWSNPHWFDDGSA
ncbi:MAG: CehA/McbA family metallohydrolase [Paracoccaceae bacterium]|jgi:hypothetical protein|nr:CehA/McbA family metallohydrolase [Paracoccaceae bacterium]